MKHSFIKNLLISGWVILATAWVAVFAQTNIDTNIFNAVQTIMQTVYTDDGSAGGNVIVDINNGSGIFIANEMLTGSRWTRILWLDGENNVRIVPWNICSMVETVFACTIDPDGSQWLCPAMCINNLNPGGWDSPWEVGAGLHSVQVIGDGTNQANGAYWVVGWHSNIITHWIANFIGGGKSNSIDAWNTNNIVGGNQNSIQWLPSMSNIVGWDSNTIFASAINGSRWLTIVWWSNNSITGSSMNLSFIGWWANNIIEEWTASSIVGGKYNHVKSYASSILGGESNIIYQTWVRSLIGGWFGNRIEGGRSFIWWGSANRAVPRWSVIGWGEGNQTHTNDNAWDNYATEYPTIGWGRYNEVRGKMSTIAGGMQNIIQGTRSTIAGGNQNQIQGDYSFIGGGSNNTNNWDSNTIGWGWSNTITGISMRWFIGGGTMNTIEWALSFVGWGVGNGIAWSQSSIIWGEFNGIDGSNSIIWWGGQNSITNASYSSIVWGHDNALDWNYSFIGGWIENQITWDINTIHWGLGNEIVGSFSSVVWGSMNTVRWIGSTAIWWSANSVSWNNSISIWTNANVNWNNIFMRNSSTITQTASQDDSFIINAPSGVGINHTTPSQALDVNGNIKTQGAFVAPSDNQGITQTINLQDAMWSCTLTVEAGIITDTTCNN